MADTTKPATMREHWQKAQFYLQAMTVNNAYEMWLQQLRPLSYENGVLVLAAPNAECRDWVALRLDRVIRNALWMQTGRDLTVQYVLQDGGAPC